MDPIRSSATSARRAAHAQAHDLIRTGRCFQASDRLIHEIETSLDGQSNAGLAIESALFIAQSLKGVENALIAHFVCQEI